MQKTTELAKTLVIRELPEDVAEILEQYKNYRFCNTNTKASLAIIREWYRQLDSIRLQREQLAELQAKYDELEKAARQLVHAQREAGNVVKELEYMLD